MIDMKLKTSDFDYYLPEHLIAQNPAEARDKSRLLVVDRSKRKIEERKFFSEIIDYFSSSDVIVFNNSKVIPARLLFYKSGKEYEVFLLRRIEITSSGEELWEALVRPGKKIKKGFLISTEDGELEIEVIDFLPFKGGRKIKIHFDVQKWNNVFLLLEKYGTVPLPPYVKDFSMDIDRYQTVFANIPGSAAAPTAGLHFTKDLLEKLREMKKVEILYVTLHVGLGTFRPVTTEYIEEHKIHSEVFWVSEKVRKRLLEAKNSGKKITACGTTSVRVLETIADKLSQEGDLQGETDIFIYPGYRFKLVDRLITNFHLPRSTLLMLVSAFAGKDLIDRAYQYAVKREFRFFSFGDAMFIM